MKLAASRQLDRHPTDLITVADGVIVLTSCDDAALLEAYDDRLAPMWSKQLGAVALALVAAGRTPWVLDPEGAWAFGPGGDCLARVKARPREGMRLSAFAPVEDGVVFAWQHGNRTPMRPPTLERVDLDGTARWSSTLPVGAVAYDGVVQMSAAEAWKPRPLDSWVPETWFSTSRTLTVSGDAVLACFSEMPRSGIGHGYAVSLADGELRFTTRTGPVSEVAPLGGGVFLVGYQGYGVFETLRYDRDGRVPERWASHGHYVLGDDVRVIELENTLPSETHLVRLLPGGAVAKGEWLDGYFTSRPLRGVDGTAYFFRKGALLAAPDLSIDERLVLAAPDDRQCSTGIVGGVRGLYFAYTQGWGGRAGTSLVRIEL